MAHQQGNPRARGKVRSRKMYRSRKKKLGGVKLAHQEGFWDQQGYVNPKRKGKSLGQS